MRPGTDRRVYKGGEARLMARADNYVMARKPGSIPFVIYEKDWLALPIFKPKPQEAR